MFIISTGIWTNCYFLHPLLITLFPIHNYTSITQNTKDMLKACYASYLFSIMTSMQEKVKKNKKCYWGKRVPGESISQRLKEILIKNSKYSLFPAINFQFIISTYIYTPWSEISKWKKAKWKNAIFNKENDEMRQELTRSMYKKTKLRWERVKEKVELKMRNSIIINNKIKNELLHKDVKRVTRDEEEEEELGIGMQNVKVLNSDPNSYLSLSLCFSINSPFHYMLDFVVFSLIFVGGILDNLRILLLLI